MSPQLIDAIRSLYSTFSRYAAADLSCCDSPDGLPLNLHLRATRVDRLAPADLERYAWKAMTTWGTVDHFKHFLPRLFELFALDGRINDCPPEVLLGKLACGEWQTWPARERAAVDDYLRALWRHLRQTHPYALSADAFLCGLGACVDDLSPWLAEWEGDPESSLSSALHLAEAIEYNVLGALSHKRPRVHPANAFWKLPSRPADQFWAWLTAPARRARLEAAFFAHGPADAEGRISRSVSYLEVLWTRSGARP